MQEGHKVEWLFQVEGGAQLQCKWKLQCFFMKGFQGGQTNVSRNRGGHSLELKNINCENLLKLWRGEGAKTFSGGEILPQTPKKPVTIHRVEIFVNTTLHGFSMTLLCNLAQINL